jgi:phosphate-selective porin
LIPLALSGARGYYFKLQIYIRPVNMKKATLLIGLLLITIINSNTILAQGCVETSSDDGPQIVGYIQPQFNSYLNGDKANGDPIKPSSFFFKRARVGIVGSIPYDVSYYVMAEFSPGLSGGSPYLLDAFVTYAPFGKYLKFSLGQYKSPFSLELNTPCFALNTIRRSTVVNELAAPFRDMGLMLLGSSDSLFGIPDLISYKVAILNGTGINHIDDNSNKDIAARIVIAPWQWLKIGGSYRTGFVGTKDINDEQKRRTRTAFDLTFEKWNFMLQGEYLMGQDIGEIAGGGGCGGKATATTLPTYDKDGFWVAAMYMTPWSLQPIVKYETYNPDGTAYSYLGNTQTYDQNTITFGLNYFLNDWTRIQVNYLYNSEGKTNGDFNEYDNDAFMIQVQAKF